MHLARRAAWTAVLCGLPSAFAQVPLPPTEPATSGEEIIVAAPEPRYVAPTQRDRIGRVWAPVYINGQGPLRLVLDTGASSSAVTTEAAERLGLSLANARTVLLRGVTGAKETTMVDVDKIEIGDLIVEPPG